MGQKKRLEPEWTPVGRDREAPSTRADCPWGLCDPLRESQACARVLHLPAGAAEACSHGYLRVPSPLPAPCSGLTGLTRARTWSLGSKFVTIVVPTPPLF